MFKSVINSAQGKGFLVSLSVVFREEGEGSGEKGNQVLLWSWKATG